MIQITKSYKEPIFLFTSGSLRFAAWAGWFSAFGNKDMAEKWIHQAHAEWIKELGIGRRFSFLDRYNSDIPILLWFATRRGSKAD